MMAHELEKLLRRLAEYTRFAAEMYRDEYNWDKSETADIYECANKARELASKLEDVSDIVIFRAKSKGCACEVCGHWVPLGESHICIDDSDDVKHYDAPL